MTGKAHLAVTLFSSFIVPHVPFSEQFYSINHILPHCYLCNLKLPQALQAVTILPLLEFFKSFNGSKIKMLLKVTVHALFL